jgi:hypothetical protein
MIRLKLFGLMIAFALLALVRPRKVLEMLEAADDGVKARADADLRRRMDMLVQRADDVPAAQATVDEAARTGAKIVGMSRPACQIPPPGWRCTRGAGHPGPCAAVEDVTK